MATARAQANIVPNAFAVLRSNAARAFEAHNYFAGLVDGRWCCAIWRKGEPVPSNVPAERQAWTSSARISIPRIGLDAKAKRSVELHLCSNVPSAAETTARQAPLSEGGRRLQAALQQVKAPGHERYQGGVPLLKSAVQVRSLLGLGTITLVFVKFPTTLG
jgi:hypothetical protein